MGTEVAVVTQGFHMYRAIQLAKAAGFEPYSLVAETDPLLFPEYYGCLLYTSPVMTVNDEVYGRLAPEDVDTILAQYMA